MKTPISRRKALIKGFSLQRIGIIIGKEQTQDGTKTSNKPDPILPYNFC